MSMRAQYSEICGREKFCAVQTVVNPQFERKQLTETDWEDGDHMKATKNAEERTLFGENF